MLSIFKGAIAWKPFAHGRRNKCLQSRKLTLEKCFDSTSVGKEANECLDKCSWLTRSAKKVNTGRLRHSISHISEMRGWQRKRYGPEENLIAQRLLFYSPVVISCGVNKWKTHFTSVIPHLSEWNRMFNA